MKTIIEMAREAGWTEAGKPQTGYEGYHAEFVENITQFATLVKAARDAELLEGVEMPEPYVYVSEHNCLDPYLLQVNRRLIEVYRDNANRIEAVYTADQLRSTVAAAVLREREFCAKAVEAIACANTSRTKASVTECAAAIRNRSNT